MAAEGLTRLDSSVGKAVKLLTVNYLRDQFEWPYRDRFNSGLEDWLWRSCRPLRHEVRDVVDHVSHRIYGEVPGEGPEEVKAAQGLGRFGSQT